MTSLNERLQGIAVIFGNVLGKTYHYRKKDRVKAPYAVWAENGEPGSFSGDGKKGEQGIAGTLDFFTLDEFDPLVDDFQTALADRFGSSWSLIDVQYEEETNLIHYSWSWEDT